MIAKRVKMNVVESSILTGTHNKKIHIRHTLSNNMSD